MVVGAVLVVGITPSRSSLRFLWKECAIVMMDDVDGDPYSCWVIKLGFVFRVVLTFCSHTNSFGVVC